MKCPACGFANEDGVLFCEKCKADLEMPAAASPAQVSTPMNETHPSPETNPPVDEPIPLEPVSLEPVVDPTLGAADEAPIELEPVGDAATIEQAGTSDTADKAAPPPLPGARQPITNPKLIVVRGQRVDVEYPLYTGKNYLGRTDDKPVDIDLDDQESPDRIWCSRQHAVITYENGTLTIEDLNSLNGTFVNRTRVHPGQVRDLHENDVIQVGTVHMKVAAG